MYKLVGAGRRANLFLTEYDGKKCIDKVLRPIWYQVFDHEVEVLSKLQGLPRFPVLLSVNRGKHSYITELIDAKVIMRLNCAELENMLSSFEEQLWDIHFSAADKGVFMDFSNNWHLLWNDFLYRIDFGSSKFEQLNKKEIKVIYDKHVSEEEAFIVECLNHRRLCLDKPWWNCCPICCRRGDSWGAVTGIKWREIGFDNGKKEMIKKGWI